MSFSAAWEAGFLVQRNELPAYSCSEVLRVKKGKVSYFLVVLFVCACGVAACFLGSRAVSVMAVNALRDGMTTVVLDAGHGGLDGGATSCTGKLESSYNLEIARRLNDLLHLLGYPTRMIRTTDTSVYTAGNTIAQKKMSDLKERVRVCNETENALLLSIHQNNFSDSRYSGAQVFYAGTENSQALAETMQAALVQTLNPGSKRQIKKASGIYLMEHIACTGVLIECGFLSNAEEEAKLSSPDYQMKLCCVIACVVSQFVEEGYTNT